MSRFDAADGALELGDAHGMKISFAFAVVALLITAGCGGNGTTSSAGSGGARPIVPTSS